MNIVQQPNSDLYDAMSLGEVMLRLDPGESRIHTTRSFRVWEGGGEYNVVRALRRVFSQKTGVITALVDNPVGRLIEDLILQGGVCTRDISWTPHDGLGKSARNGLNFTERGFGIRNAVGCYDRGNTACSQMTVADLATVNFNTRLLHTGGIFVALSNSTPVVAREAMLRAKQAGALVSYDLNYRHSLWQSAGGQTSAQQINRSLMPMVDILFGNEEDFSAALGLKIEGLDLDSNKLDSRSYSNAVEAITKEFPNLKVVATTLRVAKSASKNDWGALLFCQGKCYESAQRADLEILDRVGGGDSFASGVLYGVLTNKDPQWTVECGAAHGALAMTTPGDTSMATLSEVEKAMLRGTVRIER